MGDDEVILTVERDVLLGDNHFEGFRYANEFDYRSIILDRKNIRRFRKGDIEKNPGYKQPIAYSMVVNPTLKEIFVFQRASKKEYYNEERLWGMISWGVSGHMNESDLEKEDFIEASRVRELGDETDIDMGSIKNTTFLGYVNTECEAGKVHFGLLYFVRTDAIKISPKDPELKKGKLRPIGLLESICSRFNVEPWSKISIEPLKKYMYE